MKVGPVCGLKFVLFRNANPQSPLPMPYMVIVRCHSDKYTHFQNRMLEHTALIPIALLDNNCSVRVWNMILIGQAMMQDCLSLKTII